MNYKCQCCGFEQEFKDGEEAFQAGWDCPPHFTGYVCCDLCPAVCIVLGRGHTFAHALWAREGRPKDFSFDKCADDTAFGNSKTKAEVEAFSDELKELIAEMKRVIGVE